VKTAFGRSQLSGLSPFQASVSTVRYHITLKKEAFVNSGGTGSRRFSASVDL